MTDKTANSLAEKIAAASLAVGTLAADKRNTQQNYDYLSSDKILDRAGSALADVGVMLVPAIVDEEMMVHPTANGKERFDARVTFSMTLSDGETTLEFPWIGRGSDYSVPDKAAYKAITSGHKYFLMKLLNIGVGNEDGEHEAETPVQRPVQRPQGTQQRVQGDTAHEGVTRPPQQRTADGQVLLAAPPPPDNDDLDGIWDKAEIVPDEDEEPDFTPYVGIVHNVNITIPKGAMDCISYLRQKHKASKTAMSPRAYGTLVGHLDKVVGEGEKVHGKVLSCICGTNIWHNNRPGNLTNEMIDWLAEPKTYVNKVAILRQILGLCKQVEGVAQSA